MKIYVGHPSSINYQKNLYEPLRSSSLTNENKIILPHEESDELFDSRSFLEKECDIIIAEVSEPSTGLGIELGWADMYDVPIHCIHMEQSSYSSALTEVADKIYAYRNSDELVEIVEKIIEKK